MSPLLRLLYSAALLFMCIPISSQESLEGSVYRTFDFRIIEMNFYDDTHCECTQSFYFPMPHEPICKVDTFVYRVEKSRLHLDVPSVSDTIKLQNTLCKDYLMYGFFFSRFVMRENKPLLQYPISPVEVDRGIQATKASWITWSLCAEGIFRYNDVLTMNGGLTLYRTAGAPYKYADNGEEEIDESICDEYECAYPCDEELRFKMFENYRWFSRPYATLSTEETLAGIVGKRYIYATDTIVFSDGMSCTFVQHDSLPRICTYHVDGSNILISGLEENMSGVVDTLVYDCNVIYHAFVTHFSNTVNQEAVKGQKIVALRQPTALELSPTARMETRAYICENEIVTDEQIGSFFQHTYMPLNFHSVNNTIGDL